MKKSIWFDVECWIWIYFRFFHPPLVSFFVHFFFCCSSFFSFDEFVIQLFEQAALSIDFILHHNHLWIIILCLNNSFNNNNSSNHNWHLFSFSWIFFLFPFPFRKALQKHHGIHPEGASLCWYCSSVFLCSNFIRPVLLVRC